MDGIENQISLFSVVVPKEDLRQLFVDEDGNINTRPISYVGFEDFQHPSFARNKPHVRLWFTTDRGEWGVYWEKSGAHWNKRNGACECGTPECKLICVATEWTGEPTELERNQANQRVDWFKKLSQRKSKTRAANQRHKDKLVSI